jgi:hypothetical protein
VSISSPGKVDDLGGAALDAWSGQVSGLINKAIGESDFGGGPPPFYNPLDEPLEATSAVVTWPALSGKLRALTHLSENNRWELADRERLQSAQGGPGRQDEYCEWSVTRDTEGKITRVTFTSEVLEWWDHIAQTDRTLLGELYSDLVGMKVPPDELFEGGAYNPTNDWNAGTKGPLVHLAQQNNNLWAAISLSAAATVVREQDGKPVTDTQTLMGCASLGDKDRFSDPSIATTINAEAAKGARISLADPPGLYLKGIRTGGMRLPKAHEDLDPADFWFPDRGEPGHTVRAHFEVPDGAFTISDIMLDGKPIITGAQLAQRVDVFISALVHQGDFQPVVKECGA